VIAAWHASRGLAYLSTTCYVSWLNFWVRNETRCFPTAMAAITTCVALIFLMQAKDRSFSSPDCFFAVPMKAKVRI